MGLLLQTMRLRIKDDLKGPSTGCVKTFHQTSFHFVNKKKIVSWASHSTHTQRSFCFYLRKHCFVAPPLTGSHTAVSINTFMVMFEPPIHTLQHSYCITTADISLQSLTHLHPLSPSQRRTSWRSSNQNPETWSSLLRNDLKLQPILNFVVINCLVNFLSILRQNKKKKSQNKKEAKSA